MAISRRQLVMKILCGNGHFEQEWDIIHVAKSWLDPCVIQDLFSIMCEHRLYSVWKVVDRA